MQTNLENLIELLAALGYKGRVEVQRVDVVPIRYDLSWPIPQSYETPSSTTVEEAAKRGIEIVDRLVRSRREECVKALESIDRIVGSRS